MSKYLVEENIYRLPAPVPFPMKYIYCYLFKEEEGWTLVDTGFNYEEGRQFWLGVFKELSIQPQEIKTIYLTHYHPDHIGLAGWLQEMTDSPVYINPIEYAMVERTWGVNSKQVEKMGEMSLANGVTKELTEQIMEHMDKMESHVTPLPELTKLETDRINLGGKEYQVIQTPGHSDGHLCFYEPVSKAIFVGDHILDKITPNISLWPDCNPNPLKTYLESLNKVATFDIVIAYPAHGKVIDDIYTRIDEIIAHHNERLDLMADIARAGKTGYQVAQEVFSHINLNPHQWRFALAETLAHLEYLYDHKRLQKQVEDKIIYYSQS